MNQLVNSVGDPITVSEMFVWLEKAAEALSLDSDTLCDAFANQVDQKPEDDNPDSEDYRSWCMSSPHYTLRYAFPWDGSFEGYVYWSRVYAQMAKAWEERNV